MGRGNERGRVRGVDLREKEICRMLVKDLREREKEGGRIKREKERGGGNKNSTRG